MLFKGDQAAGLVSGMAFVCATQNWHGKEGVDTLMNYERSGVCAWWGSLVESVPCVAGNSSCVLGPRLGSSGRLQ